VLLSYVLLPDSPNGMPELCVVPDLPDNTARPVRVDVLIPNTAAVYYMGSKEALNVEPQQDPSVRILRPIPPAVMLLTPNSGTQPGIPAARVKIIYKSPGEYETFYSRDNSDNWRAWVANSTGSGAVG
jgi:hypothetical protein